VGRTWSTRGLSVEGIPRQAEIGTVSGLHLKCVTYLRL